MKSKELAMMPAGELLYKLKLQLVGSQKIINQLISDFEDYLTIEDDAESITIHEKELKNLNKLNKDISKHIKLFWHD